MKTIYRIKKVKVPYIFQKIPHLRFFVFYIFITCGFFSAGHFFVASPTDFPVGETINIARGATLRETAKILQNKKMIKSKVAFMLYVFILGSDKNVVAGDYFFAGSSAMPQIAKKITSGDHGIRVVKVTIKEGATVTEIAGLLKGKLKNFNREKFISLANTKEGYLFPDTYYFLENTKPEEVARAMEESFQKKISKIQRQVARSKHPVKDLVTMASLLEKEAGTLETKRQIAGILWKRIELNMPLQVDAVFLYINKKNTYDLTRKDLASDSPYNTYRYTGLPPGPIGNPGLDSLLAAAEPTESDYLFYLSDRQGNIYYSRDFDEHKYYKQLYVN